MGQNTNNHALIQYIDSNIGHFALYEPAKGHAPIICIIASKVNPDTNIIGIDLLDGFAITTLAELSQITLLTSTDIAHMRSAIELRDIDIHTKGGALTDKETIECYITHFNISEYLQQLLIK